MNPTLLPDPACLHLAHLEASPRCITAVVKTISPDFYQTTAKGPRINAGECQLIAGILVQSVILGSAFSSIGAATDLQLGLVDRFRSLPMAKSAVLLSRTLADLIRSTCILLIVWVVGLLVGFRPGGTILNWGAALGLLLLSSFMFSWFSALLGLVLSSVEAVQQSFVIWALPLMFASSALVPTSTMPGWLRPFVEHQPVSLLINAIRGLVLNHPDATATWQAIVWCVDLLMLFIPLAVWAYERRTSR